MFFYDYKDNTLKLIFPKVKGASVIHSLYLSNYLYYGTYFEKCSADKMTSYKDKELTQLSLTGDPIS